MAYRPTLPRPQLIKLDSLELTDHNRSELSISTERIERSARMADGRMRKYVIPHSDKRTWQVSWENLPGDSSYTVDGKAGAEEMRDFYHNNKGVMSLHLDYGLYQQDWSVFFESFSITVSKRGPNTNLYVVELSVVQR